MNVKTAILIPARMGSSRFPGKPLAPIEGIPMVIYCAKNAIETGLDVFVCTDSEEIMAVCSLYNVKSILTPECATGTDRIAMATKEMNLDYVINLQGDEPLIKSQSLNEIIKMLPDLKKKENVIINGVTEINSEEAFDPNNVKCALINNHSTIQYLSRKPLLNSEEDSNKPKYFKQLGLYAMSIINLQKFANMPKGALEAAERVELLRWIENKNELIACHIKNQTISVDTPNDLVKVLNKINEN